jgi:small subunit ribosomal protein S5
MQTEEAQQQYQERVVNVDRVARVVKGGRRFRFRALVVVGDQNGRVGVGLAKSDDVTTAVSKASSQAKKHFIQIPVEEGTIPHTVEAKHSGGHVLLKPAGPGTGVIAGGAIRDIAEMAGLRNVLTKSLGSPNKINISYATIDALGKIIPSPEVSHENT